jgi:hypothetical protein
LIFRKGYGKMLSTERATMAQAAISMTPQQALVIARKRFSNLTATGILGSKHSGPPIDLNHVVIALKFLAQCRKTKVPAVHSFDLRQAIGGVSVGATIAAAIALGFSVQSWRGSMVFAPHAMIGVNAKDIWRLADS